MFSQPGFSDFEAEQLASEHTTITLLSQSEIDNFSKSFNGCDTVDILIVKGRDITNLKGLASLKKIRNYLSIKSTSLIDFDELNHIDLNSLDYLIINNNEKLLNLDGLNFRENINHLTIRKNKRLKEIDNLDNLNHAGYFYLSSNDSLISLGGLRNLRSVDRFTIYNNGRLQNLDGLESLERVVTLSLFENHNLFNIDALSALAEYDLVHIFQNCSLTDCCGVMNVIANSNEDNYLNISYNSVGCGSKDEVKENCVNSLIPVPEGITPIFISNPIINGTRTDFLESLKVYPNPFDDYITMECDVSDLDIEYILYDANGRPILLGKLASNVERINTSAFHAGNYFLRIRADRSLQTFKLVKY